jgi:hypothetical protein
MSNIAPALGLFRSLPSSFSERYKTTSEAMATVMKVRPSGIVLHHCKASGFQPGSPSRAVECAGPWGFVPSDVPGERGRSSSRIARTDISLVNPERTVIGEVVR